MHAAIVLSFDLLFIRCVHNKSDGLSDVGFERDGHRFR